MESQNNSLPWVTLDCEKLPSRGLPYPKGVKVKYRAYTHGEVRNASISTFDLSNSLELALQGIEAIGFQKNKLTLQDAIFLSLLRKSSSMNGMQMEVPFICGHCGKDGKKIFSEKDIEFNDISEEVEELPISVTLAGKELEFTPMTVQQFMDYERGVYNKFLKDGKVDAMGVEALMVSNMKFEEAYKFLFSLTSPDDLEVIEELDKLLLHDVKRLEARCTNILDNKSVCNQVNYLRLEGREGLIRPFREGEGSARSRIRLSKKQPSESVSDTVPGVPASPGPSQEA